MRGISGHSKSPLLLLAALRVDTYDINPLVPHFAWYPNITTVALKQ